MIFWLGLLVAGLLWLLAAVYYDTASRWPRI